ncbi:unnamed protein product, partial [Porites lobata]
MSHKRAKVDRTSGYTYESVDWSICIFCQKKKYKGVKELISVGSFDSCQAIVDAAIARDDQRLLLNIKVVDLIAEEAKYHGKLKTSVSQQSSEDFEVDENTRQYMEQDKATISYQAAQIIKNDIKQCKGISIKPLCVEDVSIEKGE